MRLLRLLVTMTGIILAGSAVATVEVVDRQSPMQRTTEELATFPGRVSRMNATAGLVRVRLEWRNARYLNKGDRVEIWNESNPSSRCLSFVEGKSSEYLLLRVPEYNSCVARVAVAVGAYLFFWSKDLENNLKVGKELVGVLMKKRMALLAKKRRHERDLEAYVDRVDAITKRYEILRRKLEAELHTELSDLEEDKARQYVAFKQTESRLNQLESKLEQYKIHDENFSLDRWSLDPNLYIKK